MFCSFFSPKIFLSDINTNLSKSLISFNYKNKRPYLLDKVFMYTSSFKVNFAKESTLINRLGCWSSSGLIPHSLLISIYISFISIFDFNILSVICQMIKYKINIQYCIYFFLGEFFPLISPLPLLEDS